MWKNERNNLEMNDEWVLQQTTVIKNPVDSLKIVNEIINSKETTLDGKIVISLDCEGVDLGPTGQLTLIQIGTIYEKAYIFDVLECPRLIQDGGLKTLLESEKIIKVIHDCRRDSVNLYKQCDVKLKNVFDTSVAHKIFQSQKTGIHVFYVGNVNLNNLCEIYGAKCNYSRDNLKVIYRINPRYWADRPLTRKMVISSGSDVLCLVPKIYNTMSGQMKEKMLPLFADLCEKQIDWY